MKRDAGGIYMETARGQCGWLFYLRQPMAACRDAISAAMSYAADRLLMVQGFAGAPINVDVNAGQMW